jgi:dihydropteroate synthase
MGRPASRDRLAEAAFALFDERGYEQTTVDDITERAGLGRTTFFRHYRVKEDVIFPDHDRLLALIRDRLLTSGPGSPLAATCDGVRLVLLHYLDEGDLARRRYALTSKVAALRDREIASVARYQRLFREFLDAHGEPDPLRAELMAAAVVAAHNHVLRRWLRAECADPLGEVDEAMRQVTALFAAPFGGASGTTVVAFRTGQDLDALLPALRRLTEGRLARGAPRCRAVPCMRAELPAMTAEAQRPLRLGTRSFPPEQLLIMAIVNRTPDSFYDRGATWDEAAALQRVHAVVAAGADIVDIGGVPAAPGAEVTAAEEIRRTVPFVAAVRSAYPDVVISVDTWRHEVARELCAAGADLINDSWGGWDERLPEVAAEHDAGLVCSHAGGLPPRNRPFRVEYDDVVADVLKRTLAQADRAVALGVDPSRVLIDPAHDFGKNTWHSLEVTRRLGEMAATGWPVLVSVSHKDFIGETLNAGRDDRLVGTLAATTVCAWLGGRVFRAHQVTQTRQVLDMVSAIRGDLAPARAVRGLA